MFNKWAMLFSVGSFQLPGSRTGCGTRANPFIPGGLSFPLRIRGLEERFPPFFPAPFRCGSVMSGEMGTKRRGVAPKS